MQQMQRLWTSESAHKEGTVEYVLSDYEEDIKRILYTDVRHTPSGAYGDADECVCIGSVEYHVVYQSSLGGVFGVRFSSEYEMVLDVPEDVEHTEGRVEVVSSSLRPVSSRKLMGKYALAARCRGVKKESCTPLGDAMEREGTVLLPRTVHTSLYDTARTDEREYAEELCRSHTESKYLYYDADVRVERTATASGGMIVSGVTLVRALAEREGEGIVAIEKRIPFEEFIVSEGEMDGCEAVGVGDVSSVTVTERREEDEYVSVVSVICRFTVHKLGHGCATVVRDLYSTEYETRVEYAERECITEEHIASLSFPFEERVDRSVTESPEMEEVLLMGAEIRLHEVRAADKSVRCIGELTCNILGRYADENGVSAYQKNTLKFPFDRTVAFADAKDGMQLTPIRTTPRCRVWVDENELVVEGEMELVSYFTTRESVRAVREGTVGEPLAKELGADDIWILYPETNLWEIAKENHLSVAKICTDNGLKIAEEEMDDKDSIAAVSRLWIEA